MRFTSKAVCLVKFVIVFKEPLFFFFPPNIVMDGGKQTMQPTKREKNPKFKNILLQPLSAAIQLTSIPKAI